VQSITNFKGRNSIGLRQDSHFLELVKKYLGCLFAFTALSEISRSLRKCTCTSLPKLETVALEKTGNFRIVKPDKYAAFEID